MFEQLKIYYHSLMFAWEIRKFYGSIAGMVNHAMALGDAVGKDQSIDRTLGTVKDKVRRK